MGIARVRGCRAVCGALLALVAALVNAGCANDQDHNNHDCIKNTGGTECATPADPKVMGHNECPLDECYGTAGTDYEANYRYTPACNRTVEIDGLTWSVCSPWAEVSQPCAECYARSLELCGESGWRLPTIAELASLYDVDNATCTGTSNAARIRAPFSVYGAMVWSSSLGQVFSYYAGQEYDVPPDYSSGKTVLLVRP